MGDESRHEFDVGPADEMRRKYGWAVEGRRPEVLDRGAVPPGLRDLIPLAERWGIACDVTRDDALANATEADRAELSERLRGRHDEIEDWLYSFPLGAPVPREASAFQAMVVAEVEAGSGPGLRGYLDWAFANYRRSPSASVRERLRDAYDHASRNRLLKSRSREDIEAIREALSEGE